MLKLALKTLAQNKIRLGLTAFAIVLGVGFVVSSFVLRDGLKEVFNDLAAASVAGIDIAIDAENPDNDPVTQVDFDAISGIDGIGAAEITMTGEGYENRIQPIKPDGTTIELNGPPQLTFGWFNERRLASTSIVDGRAPEARDEWVIDPPSLERHGFVVGDTYTFVTPSGQRDARLVGTFTFDGFIEGPTFMALQADTIRDYMLFGDRFDAIAIAADGSVPIPDMIAEINTILNPGDFPRLIVQDQEQLVADTQAEFGQVLDIIGGILLGFALVALFVSIFIIANTFAITTSQRTRELGLLRAIGATPSQILRSVLSESVVIGLLSSLVGIGAGVVIAFVLRAILNQVGAAIPSFGVVLTPLTIVLAFVVGTTVTVISAVVPAFSASRTSPIAAITGQSTGKKESIGRFVIGAVVTAIGIALMLVGLFGGADSVLGVLAPLGGGAAVLFIGITLLSPLVAGPLARILGTPIQGVFNTPGRLSKQNAARNPRRTATTAAALMIGLSLVSMASVLGESFKAEFDNILNTSIQSDFLVISDQADVPDEAVDAIRESGEFGNVTAVKYWSSGLTNEPIEPQFDPTIPADAVDAQGRLVSELYNVEISALDYSQIDGLFNFEVTQGSFDAMTIDTAAVRINVLDDLGLALGDDIQMIMTDGSEADLEIVAVFEEAQISTGVMLTFDRFELASPLRSSDWIAASVAEGTSVEDADAAFTELGTAYPNLAFQSSAEFRQTFSDQIGFVLNLLTILLGLTIFIAILGIANTLALSVFERTREIGLLRAVGMTRRQSRRMIRWEAVIIAAVGAVLGTALGVALGVLMVNAIPGDFISAFAIPWTRILIMVSVTSAMGLLAALFPAWRASRMNVLDAISQA